MAVFAIPGLVFLILIWAMPDDLRMAPDRKLIWKLLIVSLAVTICVPPYYAITIPGLPWISIRRLALAPLLITVAMGLGLSPTVRERFRLIFTNSMTLFVLLCGFEISAFLSLFFSQNFATSSSRFVTNVLEWFVPMVCILVSTADTKGLKLFLNILLYCAAAVALGGFYEFWNQKHLFIEILPEPIYRSLLSGNPSLVNFVNAVNVRNGMYRASSIYTNPLSFGELCALVLPVAFAKIAYGKTPLNTAYGLAFCFILLVGIFSSGARGAYMGAFAAILIFFVLWVIDISQTKARSLLPPIVFAFGFMGFVAVVILVAFWRKAHNIVFGDGMAQYSTDARLAQWNAALPHVYKSPIFGNGFGIGGDVVQYGMNSLGVSTLDSSLISIIVEQGALGIFCFFGMIICAMIVLISVFMQSRGTDRQLSMILIASLAAYLMYRFVLSQVDNNFLLLAIIGMTGVLKYEVTRKQNESSALTPAQTETRLPVPRFS